MLKLALTMSATCADNCAMVTRAEILAQIRQDGETVLLAFSRGKDSLSAYLTLRDAGFCVVPFHMALVPGLSFVEESLAYYEHFFETPIIRVMHPNFFRWLRTLAFQPPLRCAVLSQEALQARLLPRISSFTQINQAVMRQVGLPTTTWTAMGTRAADSVERRSVIQRAGPIQHVQRTFWPVWDMLKADLLACLSTAGVKLPLDYRLWGRSFDGIDWHFLQALRDQLPADYARVLFWFPLAYLEFPRAALAQRCHRAA